MKPAAKKSEAKATVKLPAGVITHDETPQTVERALPDGEPPPWPANRELAVVGKPTPRIDGALKVTGRAKYTADIQLPGMLYGRVVRAKHPHARIHSIDVSAAERHPGVRAVHVLTRVLGVAQGSGEDKQKFPTIRYAGQPIAAVAADTPAAAEDAVRLVTVGYDPLPFVVDLDDAQQPNAPLVFAGQTEQRGSAGGGGSQQGVSQNGNVRGPARSGPEGPPSGDVEKGLAAADAVVEASYRTQVQTHSALETHGVVAHYQPDQLTVYASTQGTSTVRDELAEVFGLPKSKIRVVTEFMGAGFGAKFGIGNFGVLATHLSMKANAPVRLMLDRKEEHLSVGNRPNSHQRLRIGAKKDGSLTAIHLVSHGTAGAAAGAGTGGPAKNMYPCPNILIEEHDVFTHAGPGAAFRAPGHPQGCFALEQSIDELAEKLSMDPLKLRDRIDHDDSGMVDSASRRRERSIGAERIGWSKRHAPGADSGVVKRGIGVAQSVWYRIIDLDSSCEVRIMRDGSVQLSSAVQDIGTGIRTALAQVVAEELGLRAADITIAIGDTAFPIGPASGGSKTTDSITPAARRAAYQVKKIFIEQVAKAHGADPAKVTLAGGKVDVAGKEVSFRAAAAKLRTEQVSSTASRPDDYGGYARGRGSRRIGIGGMGGVQFAAVAVDTETGIITVERIVAVHDCGRPINPLAVESQIHGGVIQGVSYALYENRQLDRSQGLMVNPNFESYKIAGARDIPDIEAVLVEEYRGRSNTDASGIGEPATVPTAGAIANAVYNAIGVRVRELPMTPARVLAALAGKEAR